MPKKFTHLFSNLIFKFIIILVLLFNTSAVLSAPIIQTYSNNVPASVDPRQTSPVNRTVSVPAIDFPSNSRIVDINISITFDKRDRNNGVCTAFNGGNVFNNEITFRLIGPNGTSVDLVNANTGYYSGNAHPGNVTVTFDDEGAVFNGSTPISGVFQPQGLLSSFDGSEAIAGLWTLFMADSAGQDPLCFFGFDLRIEATADADVSIEKNDMNLTYTPGGISIYEIVVSNAGPIDVENLIINDPMPVGAISANWTCTPSGAANCDDAAGSGGINNVTVDIPEGDSVTFSVTINWSTNISDY